MEIDNLYKNPQLIQVVAGNFRLQFLLSDFGDFQPDCVNTSELQDKYFHEEIMGIKTPPIAILDWPCKLMHTEELAGEVYVHIWLILSGQNPLLDHEDISAHISEEYLDLEKNFFNRTTSGSDSIDITSPKYEKICYPKSSKEVFKKSGKITYYQANAGSYPNGFTPLVNYCPAGKGVAIKFAFQFHGFHVKSNSEIAARDALLVSICDEFMSHVDISPLPLDERPRPSIKTVEEDDGW